MIRPIIEELPNVSSPVALFNNIKDYPNCFFLDSSCDPEKLGRFSFLGCDPFLVFKSKGDSVRLEWADGQVLEARSDPFSSLKGLYKKYNTLVTVKDSPLTSGIVGYFSYDLKDFIEDLPDIAGDDLKLPDSILGFYDVVMIHDNLEARTYIASSGLPELDEIKNSARQIARLEEFKKKIFAPAAAKKAASPLRPPALRSNFSAAGYAKAVERARQYIKDGDIYQVNLSQRFRTRLNMEPPELYLRLREASPAPFSSYLGFRDVAVLSSSPERFLLKRGSYIETRPIKGTRPRGEDAFGDSLLEAELARSEKDRAEHIMIVDLERNDLGKICEYGSVKVTESFVLERYANVFHLVSTVAGALKKDVGPIDCLLAAFPGGSITGAPKIRSMEIIDELEPVKRSVYTGAIGYLSFDGNMDTSIVIRTFVVKDGEVYFQVGGGIVADSVPEKEYEETLHKARGLMQALGINQAELTPPGCKFKVAA